MQAIHVRFLGPSNVRGSRYKATCQAGSLTVQADYALNLEGNARRAATMLCDKLGWSKTGATRWYLECGGLPDGSYAFVMVPYAGHLVDMLRGLIDAATAVSANWEKGDLASAVRRLDQVAEEAASVVIGVAKTP